MVVQLGARWGLEGTLMDFLRRAEVAQRMRCALRRDESRLNWFLNPSFGWNRRSIPPSTAQRIAVVSLINSRIILGTVPGYVCVSYRSSHFSKIGSRSSLTPSVDK
jgi:hypothetical protein